MATESEILTKLNDLLSTYDAALSVSGGSKLLTLDRAGAGDTAAVVLQQGGGERWRLGQFGADTFALQRSPTGAAVDYTDVLSVNRSTGAVTLAGALTAPLAPGSAASPSLHFSGDPDTGFFRLGADTLAAATGGVEAMRIDSAGRMAIGTTMSRAKLNIAGGGSEGYGIEHVAVGVSQPSIINLLATNSSGSASQQAHIVAYQPSGGGASDTALDFRLRGSVGGSFGAPGTIMTLIGDGRVGIGTAPLYRLDVNSGTDDIVARFASSDAGAFIDLRDNVTGAGYVRYGAVGDAAVIWAGNSERARIDSAGRLLIGTTASGSSKLRISGLPTSSAGLSAGDIWNDGGTLKIA